MSIEILIICCLAEKTTSGDISTITDYIKKEESSKNYEQQFPTESGNNATTANSTISEENDNEIFLIQMGMLCLIMKTIYGEVYFIILFWLSNKKYLSTFYFTQDSSGDSSSLLIL